MGAGFPAWCVEYRKVASKTSRSGGHGVSIFSKGSGGVGGGEAGGSAPGGHPFGLRAALLPLSAGSLAAVERGYASCRFGSLAWSSFATVPDDFSRGLACGECLS